MKSSILYKMAISSPTLPRSFSMIYEQRIMLQLVESRGHLAQYSTETINNSVVSVWFYISKGLEQFRR